MRRYEAKANDNDKAPESYLMNFRKYWNISKISSSNSRSSIIKHDLTLATFSRIETAFV
jgi:aminoglycoside/choline kinase family phosphotransferase